MTPFKILSEGLGGSVKTTNITRIDLLRLWWQVKGLGKDSVQVVDLGRFLSDVNGPGGIKIKSLDREALHQLVNQYFEVKNIFAASPDLAIVNSSGAIGAGQLAGEITTAEGFNVIHIDTGNSVIARCQVANQDKNPRVASYLANVFGCDIVSSSQDTGGNQIILNLGQDFAKRYF